MVEDKKIHDNLVYDGEKYLASYFKSLENIEEHNLKKILNAFIDQRIAPEHFGWVTGYGHDDLGKEKVDNVFAQVFNTESAVVRPSFVSGTHAISCCLFGCLRPEDELIAICGKPYDTLYPVIGLGRGAINCARRDAVNRISTGSLIDLGIKYKEIPCVRAGLKPALTDIDSIPSFVSKKTKMVFIQRSKGYEWRKSLSINEIEKIIATVKKIDKNIICFVDNCFGEFTEKFEPTDVGADIICGSLVKNIGGGIVPSGGYIAGTKELVELAASKLTAPGIGREGGCMFDLTRLILQGLYLAPNVISNVLKGISLASYIFQEKGYDVTPLPDENKTDIVVALKLNDKEKVKQICKIVQSNSPVNSYVMPVPCNLPGYEDAVIMAGGTFIEGSTIELSCDAPMRTPYILFWQGGLNYFHTKYVVSKILESEII